MLAVTTIATAATWIAARPWPSAMNPTAAATAGSRLIITPKTALARRRSASSSKT